MKDHKKACILADEALQQALEKIDDLGEEDFRDAKSIIELLKENLTLWREEEEGGDVENLWVKWPLLKFIACALFFRIIIIIFKKSYSFILIACIYLYNNTTCHAHPA